MEKRLFQIKWVGDWSRECNGGFEVHSGAPQPKLVPIVPVPPSQAADHITDIQYSK